MPGLSLTVELSTPRILEQSANSWVLRNDGTGTAPSKLHLSYSCVCVIPSGLFLFGGGHNDYHGNDPWIFNASTMTWSRVHDRDYDEYTSHDTRWAACSLSYPGSYAPVGQSNPYHPVGRHTGSALAYDPTVGKVLMSGYAFDSYVDYDWPWGPTPGSCSSVGDVWFFDPESGLWEWQFANENDVNKNRITSIVYNPNDGKNYLINTKIDNYGRYYSFDASEDSNIGANLYSGEPGLPGVCPASIDINQNKIYFLGTSGIKVFDISTSTLSTLTGITGSLPSGDGYGITYDSYNQLFLMFGAAGLYAFDPETKVCSAITDASTPPSNAGSNSWVFGAWQYDAKNNVAWYVERTVAGTNARVWTYRYA